MKIVSTSDVLDRHLKSFAEYDMDGVVADYSSDAVLFVPTGPLKGPDAIKPLFEALFRSLQSRAPRLRCSSDALRVITPIFVWTAETADNSYEFATDTFVVRNGKIIAQSFAAKIKPKR